MWTIKAVDIIDAYKLIVELIIIYGEPVSNTLELPNLMVHITKPYPQSPATYPIQGRMMEQYIAQFLNPAAPVGFTYTYGNRLFSPNQFEAALNKLKKDPNSRQAIMHTWRVESDMSAESVPCLQTIQYLVRDNRLHTTAHFRSNDMGMAWVANVNAIITLSKNAASDLGVELGSLTTISTSAHILNSEIDFITDNFKYNGTHLRI